MNGSSPGACTGPPVALRSTAPALLLVRTIPGIVSDPTDRESMASWVFRLAKANGFQTAGDLFSQMKMWMPDLGRVDLDESGRRASALLMDLTGFDHTVLERLQLTELLQVFGATDRRTGHPWVIDAGMDPKSSMGARHAVCPRCLAEDAAPYWRQAWRLSVITHCKRHACLLTGQCSNCGTAPLISSTRATALGRCHACDRPYGPTRRSYFYTQDRWLAVHPLEMQSDHPNVRVAIPAAWWQGVHILLSLVTKKHRARKLLDADLPIRHRRCLSRIATGSMPRFIDADLESRRHQLHLVGWLTANWPCRFATVMKQAGLSATDLRHSEYPVPHWVSTVSESMLVRRGYRVNSAEVSEAIKVLSAQGRSPSKIELKRMLNVTEARAVDATLGLSATCLSDSELTRVLALIDQRVQAAPPGRSEWASWVRDAACFAAMLCKGLRPRQLSSLTLNDGLCMLREPPSIGSTTVSKAAAIHKRHLAAWMQTYIHRVRPSFLRQSAPSDCLFLTRFSLPYGGFGLAERLAEILREAGVRDWRRGALLLSGTSLPRPVPGIDGAVRAGVSQRLRHRGMAGSRANQRQTQESS